MSFTSSSKWAATAEGQTVSALALIPGLLLAVTPVWYLLVGRRTLFTLWNMNRIYKMALVLALMVVELSQLRPRSRFYEAQPHIAVLISLLAFGALILAGVSKNRATKLRTTATVLTDVVLVLDIVNSGYFVYNAKLIGNTLPFMPSVLRLVVLVLPGVSRRMPQLYDHIAQIAVISGVKFIWQSPFSLTILERLEDIGPEFHAESLVERFSLMWSRYSNPRVSRYALFWAAFWSVKYEFTLICIMRCFVGAATLLQPYAIQQCLAIIQQDHSTQQGYVSLTLLMFAFLGKVLFQQLLTRLSHRCLRILHTMMSGEVMNKSLRLKVQDLHTQIPATQIFEDLKLSTQYLPICVNSIMAPIELGIGVSLLCQYIGATAMVCFISFLLAVIPSSKLLPTIQEKRTLCEQSSQVRISQSERIFAQLKGIKAIGDQNTIIAYLRSLHNTEVEATKSMRFLQMLCVASHELVTTATPIVLLFGAVNWTNSGSVLQPSVLFPTLTTAHIVLIYLGTIFAGYQHIDVLLGCHDRTQDFLGYDEHRTTRVDERPFEHEILHDLMNYMPLPSSDSEVEASSPQKSNQDLIQLLNVSVIAPGGVSPLFENVSVSVPRGKLTVVIGITASGKTQFLKALLDEVEHADGQLFLERNTSVAYCDQTVWLQQKSIQENILGGNLLDENRYAAVIEACQLRSDFNLLPQGDQTIISTGAVNLSTSQQHKIAVARGVYSLAPVLILDDPFRVLDRETGDIIFRELFEQDGLLRKEQRTVVLATCFRRYFADADLAIILDGRGNVITREGGHSFPVNLELRNVIKQLTYAAEPSLPIKTAVSASHPGNSVAVQANPPEENRNVQQHTILISLLTLLPKRSLILCCLHVGFAAAVATVCDGLAGVWLGNDLQNTSRFIELLLLAALVGVTSITMWIHCFQVLLPCLCRKAHEKLVQTVMNTQLSYLTAANHSEIVSQLSKDITTLARLFGVNLFKMTYYSLALLGDSLVIIVIVPEYGPAVIICLIGLFFLIQTRYVSTCHESAKLQQQASTPMLTHIKEVSSGVEHIRAFGWQQQFKDRGMLLLKNWQSPFFHRMDAMRWLEVILDSVAALASILIALIGICTGVISPSQVGVSLLILGTLSSKSAFAVVECAELQSNGGCLTRLVQAFESMPQELDEAEPRANIGLLDIGSIELRGVTARYGRDIDARAVLDRASLAIKAGQKAILVGKSGSGKSSVILSILRFLTYTGTIAIGDVDISTIPLVDLRTQISVMPPEPLNLPGTVEHNLLPWRLMGGADSPQTRLLANAHPQFWWFADAMEDLNLSEGQKTQFAMARLVFHHLHYENKIVLMDEPTGGLDDAMRLHLDQLIENYFEGSTVLTVSRDPESITHADVVFYLDDGETHT